MNLYCSPGDSYKNHSFVCLLLLGEHRFTQTRLGATGFIGGDLLAGLQEQYPEYEITCLVRTQDEADTIRAVYPDVKVVLGDNESAEIVERESMNADIVFRECRFKTGSYT
jgi:hypothetical protein